MKPSVFSPSDKSWIKTLILTLVFFVLIVSLSEVSLRRGWAGVDVPYPTNGYRSADDAFRALDEFTEENGKVDCIFLGSSLVAVGINPSVFEEAYKVETGETITCFNFGVSVATASSTGPLAHILVDNYQPKLLVYGTAPRDYVERASYGPEEKFQYTPWAQYNLGRFSPAGWMLDHLYVARYLTGLSGILFPAETEETGEQDGEVKRPEVVAKGIPGNYAPMLYFSAGAPINWIKKNETVTRQKISQTFNLSDVDLSGFGQIIELDQVPGLTLVVVEIPSPKLFFIDPTGAPEPSEETVFRQVIGGYAHQQGVPFWMTTELELIPYTFFSDNSHLYATGAVDFSRWLGKEIGAALGRDNLGGFIPQEFVEKPPLKNTEIKREYINSRGMSPDYQEMYKDYLLHFDLVQPDAVIFNPLENGLDREFVQTILGFYIEWDMNINRGNVHDWFALMAVQDRMITIKDAGVSPMQEQAMIAWYSKRSPNALKEAGVDYLLYTENWDNPATAPINSLLDDTEYYHLVKYWEYAPLRETYYLYEPIKDREPGS